MPDCLRGSIICRWASSHCVEHIFDSSQVGQRARINANFGETPEIWRALYACLDLQALSAFSRQEKSKPGGVTGADKQGRATRGCGLQAIRPSATAFRPSGPL